MVPLRFVTHSRLATRIAQRLGWLPGARYTNLRDVRGVDRLGFLDIDWQDYDFRRHAEAARSTRPRVTVARDITDRRLLRRVLDEAMRLEEWAESVVIVPKCKRLRPEDIAAIPDRFLLGFSVPTRYGETELSPSMFQRPVHLLGGRPDRQRRLGDLMPVASFDCNRFTLDAAFGDYFDGETFRPHPTGGYSRCLEASVRNINRLWRSYTPMTRTVTPLAHAGLGECRMEVR